MIILVNLVVILINFYPYILDANSNKVSIPDAFLGYVYCKGNDDDKFASLIERRKDVFRDAPGK